MSRWGPCHPYKAERDKRIVKLYLSGILMKNIPFILSATNYEIVKKVIQKYVPRLKRQKSNRNIFPLTH